MARKVHLLQSPELSDADFLKMYELVSQFEGPIHFQKAKMDLDLVFKKKKIADEQQFASSKFWYWSPNALKDVVQEKKFEIYKSREISFPLQVQSMAWEDLFELCENYRLQNDLPKEEQVILLTSFSNDSNWFSASSTCMRNSFIQTTDWDFYFDEGLNQSLPIAYLIFSAILEKEMFRSTDELYESVHHEVRGCMLDLCKNKKEIILKMRTADLCPDCFQIIADRAVEPLIVRQAFNAFESLRKMMLFRQRFFYFSHPLSIKISGQTKVFILPELGDVEVKLSPREKALYLLFLRHQKGICIHDLSKYKEELISLYKVCSNRTDDWTIANTVDRIINPMENVFNELCSRIRRKFFNLVGENLISLYEIAGEPGKEKKILLNREFITESI